MFGPCLAGAGMAFLSQFQINTVPRRFAKTQHVAGPICCAVRVELSRVEGEPPVLRPSCGVRWEVFCFGRVRKVLGREARWTKPATGVCEFGRSG